MITVDQPQLNRDLARWGDGVARYITELNMTAEDAVKTQTGHVMRELAESLPPTSKKRLEKNISGDVKQVFHPASSLMFRGKKQGRGDIVWLGASDRSLTGVPRNLYRPKANAIEMASMFKARRNKMGKKYTQIGYRGNQHIQKLNRVVVSKSSLSQFEKIQQGKVGKLKASIALAWNTLSVKGRKPAAWIMKHVTNRTARGSFVNGLASKEHPNFTIISNQSGCNSPIALQVVHKVLARRIQVMKSDVEKWARKRMKK